MDLAPRLALAAGLLCATACGGEPGEVATRFHLALRKGDGEQALGLLSKRSRDALAERASSAHAATGGAVPADPAAMILRGDRLGFYHGPEREHPIETSALEISGDRARVGVKVGAAESHLELVRDQGRWRVDLPLEEAAHPR